LTETAGRADSPYPVTDSNSPNLYDYDFKLRERHPNFQNYFDRNETLSVETREAYPHKFDQFYGSHSLQTIDVVPAPKKNAPVFVFIHGGFWKSLDKRPYHFTARPFLENGCAAVHINYRLAPNASMAEIVADIKGAFKWIQHNASNFNGNPAKLHIAGHSAGAHLALATAIDMESHGDPIARSVKSVLCISGIFDLDPIRHSYLNDELKFDDATVNKFSPLSRENLILNTPVFFAVGGDETNQFLEQSRNMHERLKAANIPSSHAVIPELNHFDIVYEIALPKGLIAKPALETVLRDND